MYSLKTLSNYCIYTKQLCSFCCPISWWPSSILFTCKNYYIFWPFLRIINSRKLPTLSISYKTRHFANGHTNSYAIQAKIKHAESAFFLLWLIYFVMFSFEWKAMLPLKYGKLGNYIVLNFTTWMCFFINHFHFERTKAQLFCVCPM